MPPTVNNGADTNTTEKRPPKPTERKCELICRVKYGNSLPDIPFDLKFLMYPFDGQRFVQYNPTSLEKNYKYDILTEHDLGVTIDLINRDLYQSDPYAQLDPADEKLLEDDIHTPHDSVRSRQHSRSVSWLRKSEYISTEQTRFQPQNIEKIEAKVGYNVKKSLREETLYMDRDAQINAINKTFEDSKTEIVKHYCKPNVHPVEVWPVFPDFINWKYPCAQVMFDSDPAPIGKNVPAQIEEMSQAMIRGVMDESGEQFVAYFLPTDRTLEKRREDFVNNVFYREDDEYEYKISREYNWNVKSKASKGYEENYYFVMRPDGVYYNELETRVRLTKRRIKAGQQPNNTKLVVKHRPLDATEHRMQRYRERQIEPIGEEEDSDEMEEETSVPATTTSTTTKPSDTTPSADQPMEDEEGEGADEANNPDEDQTKRDREIRSRSRSQSEEDQQSPKKSRSRSRSRSRSHLKSRSGSRSVSRSRSRSRSKTSRSRSPSGSRSLSRSVSRARSRSRSVARSKTHSRSRSVSASVSRSPSRSRSGTPGGSGTASGTDEE